MTRTNKNTIKHLIESMHTRLVTCNQSTEEIDNLYNEIMNNYDCAVLRDLEYNLESESSIARKEFEKEEKDV